MSPCDCVLNFLVDLLVFTWSVPAKRQQEIKQLCELRPAFRVTEQEISVRTGLVSVAGHFEQLHLLISQDRSGQDLVDARMKVRDNFFCVEMLYSYVQLLDKQFLFQNDMFSTNLLKGQQHNKVRINIYLRHLTEQV